MHAHMHMQELMKASGSIFLEFAITSYGWENCVPTIAPIRTFIVHIAIFKKKGKNKHLQNDNLAVSILQSHKHRIGH